MNEEVYIRNILRILIGDTILNDTIDIPAAADPADDVSIYGALRKVFDENTVLYNDLINGGRLDNLIDDIIDKSREVQDVTIYPVAEDMDTTEITDDGAAPALTGEIASSEITEGGAQDNPSWSELINFEQMGVITIISIYIELHWQQKYTAGGASTDTWAKWQISRDGGTAWVDITDNETENNPVYQNKTKAGVGVFIPTIVAGADQLGLRLCAWTDDGAASVETKIRSDSFIHITYRKS